MQVDPASSAGNNNQGVNAVDAMTKSFFVAPVPLNKNQVANLKLEEKLQDPYTAKVNASTFVAADPSKSIGRIAIIAGTTIYAKQDNGPRPGWYAVGQAPRGATTTSMTQAQSDAVSIASSAFFNRQPLSDDTVQQLKLEDALVGDTQRWNESPYPPNPDPKLTEARVAVQLNGNIYLRQTVGAGKPSWFLLGLAPN
jgi:hypothetical protein